MIKLNDGDKFVNIISGLEITVHENAIGEWFIRHSDISMGLGSGESCSERDMVKLLNSRYEKVKD